VVGRDSLARFFLDFSLDMILAKGQPGCIRSIERLLGRNYIEDSQGYRFRVRSCERALETVLDELFKIAV
jgi:hypothetical protein